MPLAGAQAQLNGRVRAGVLGLGEEVLYGDFYLRWQVALCLGEVFDGAGVGLAVVGNGFGPGRVAAERVILADYRERGQRCGHAS